MYGLGTRSYNRSTEARQMKRERAEFNAKYEAGQVQLKTSKLTVLCTCIASQLPHELSLHDRLAWDGDWRGFWPAGLRKFWSAPQRVEI